MTTKVKLRQKSISGNRQSLYLDFYPAIINQETGKPTRREFLGLYLFDKSKHPLEKQHNKDTQQIAEQIRQKRENQINKPEIYTGFEQEQLKIKEKGEQNFVLYFKTLVDKRKNSTFDNWLATYKYLFSFTNGQLKFVDLNEKFCNDFKEHLLNVKSKRNPQAKLAQNSAASYFINFKIALKQAFKDGYFNIDLNAKIKSIETIEVLKQTLTIEELKMLAKTDCPNSKLKQAALFSAITGLPYQEMENLVWGNIESSESFGIRIKIIRQKTRKPSYINISEAAYNLLDIRTDPFELVFKGLCDRDRYEFFPIWLKKAGIHKKMTFHDLRHTYGCLQIELGTDPYTLQGNMGHSTPRQSMRYGKISDIRKREAADKIKLDY
ncbi:MAG: site-specific integrase [Saprospiraceae bacterium]|jgi:integrase|nr:site-specific integrase [Saprospiraceae bacterium]